MRRGAWFGLVGLALAAGACRAPLDQGGSQRDASAFRDAGGSAAPIPVERDGGPDDAGGRSEGAIGGVAGTSPGPDGGTPARQTAAVCPDGPAVTAPAPPAAPDRVPTALPISCNPLSRTLVFPPPPAGSPGVYDRCISFSLGATAAVALSPDGRTAGLLNGDGVVRLVDVASQQVIALVAPPHARVTRMAFSPGGESLLAVAGGEHQAVLVDTSTWQPRWTVTLPGQIYGYMDDGSAGAVAFSPDGRSAVVSPGTDLHLLDVATGTVRASYSSAALLDAAYAWNGQRIVAADAVPDGSCIQRPIKGAVVVLDPATLSKQATLTSWAGYPDDSVAPAFRASPTDDLVLTPTHEEDTNRNLLAFRASDGSALPRSSLTTLPTAFMPSGALLIAAGDQLQIEPAGGAATAQVAIPTPDSAVFAVSSDGGTVAVGADGADLLRVWTVSQDHALGVCTLDDLPRGPLALSGDGLTAAVAVGSHVDIRRLADNQQLGLVSGNGNPIPRVVLSHTGRYVAIPLQSDDPALPPNLSVVAVATDSVVVSLPQQKTNYWGSLLFAPDDQTFYAQRFDTTDPQTSVIEVDLATGQTIATHLVPSPASVIGFSRGCLVVFDPNKGVYRSCESCDETPIPASGAVVSAAGDALLFGWPYPGQSATFTPIPVGVATVFGPPSVDPQDGTYDVPYAIGQHPDQVLIGGSTVNLACYAGPGFPVGVWNASSTLLDQLPPRPSAIDDAARHVAYGTEVWCGI